MIRNKYLNTSEGFDVLKPDLLEYSAKSWNVNILSDGIHLNTSSYVSVFFFEISRNKL